MKCKENAKRLCGNQECEICFARSFGSHEKIQYWSVKNDKQPWQVFFKSSYKIIFDCIKCNHEFELTPNNINAGQWCPYCSNQKLCKDTTLETGCQQCRNKTFVSCDKSQYWSVKNKKVPWQVFRNSKSKFIFDCQK